MFSKYNKSCLITSLTSVIVTIFFSPAAQTQTSALEEIVVTAQRREQSVLEVPVSLEAFSGAVLTQEGIRTFADLASFSPTVEIDIGSVDQATSIRGLGTYARNFGVETAVPIFVDGVHFGRVPMIIGAFMDLERLEVLRGPQPIAFGHNATAGAFSLTTRNPGPEWQGDVTAEYGNFGRESIEGGVGGPIIDTLGIRMAGKWDKADGFIRDIVSGGLYPHSLQTAARVTLQWLPADNFEATLKLGYSHRNQDGNATAHCRTGHPIELSEQALLIPGLTSFNHPLDPIPDDCDKGFARIGTPETVRNPFRPVPDIFQENSRTGIVDITDVRHKVLNVTEAVEDDTIYNSSLELDYTFANDISVTSITGWTDYKRIQMTNSNASIVASTQSMGAELFNMFSEEIRFLSPRGGRIEWEAGAFFQQEYIDGVPPEADSKYRSVTLRNNIRTPNRYTNFWQDADWLSAFGQVTFNFLDDKASVDVGARYTEVDKEGLLEAIASMWVFDINPIDPITGRSNSTNLDGTVRNVASSMIDCATGHPYCGTYGAGFWTNQWDVRDVPDAWNAQSPIDIGAYFPNPDQPLQLLDTINESGLDPQVTLRYRPSDNISLYGKWAQAFKGGGFNLKRATPPPPDTYILLPEDAETFEVGAKGRLLDGRALFNVTLFSTSIKNLQLETEIPAELDLGSRRGTNAGEQRTRGLEFDVIWGVSDRLTLGLNAAFMDGVMVSYPGAGCSDFEFGQADTGPCLTEDESAAFIAENNLVDENGDPLADDTFEGTIDRTGYTAPRIPDYKFVLNMDYWYPVFNRHKVTFAGRTTFSDGYITDIQGFSEFLKYDKRTIANLTLGYGDQDETWHLNFWVRNLLGRSQGIKYFPEFYPEGDGIIRVNPNPRDYTSYGLQFSYNYN